MVSRDTPDDLPWAVSRRRIPKNILLQASANPLTIEELSTELGIGSPYMEEEVAILLKANLLKKVGNRYVTNFSIVSGECQLAMYEAM